MAGRSLWSVLMVAWLSAGNASIASYDSAVSDIAVSEQEHESDGAELIDNAAPASAASRVPDTPATTGSR